MRSPRLGPALPDPAGLPPPSRLHAAIERRLAARAAHSTLGDELTASRNSRIGFDIEAPRTHAHGHTRNIWEQQRQPLYLRDGSETHHQADGRMLTYSDPSLVGVADASSAPHIVVGGVTTAALPQAAPPPRSPVGRSAAARSRARRGSSPKALRPAAPRKQVKELEPEDDDYDLSQMGKTSYRRFKRLAGEASADEDAVVRRMGATLSDALLAGKGSVKVHKENVEAAYEAVQASRSTSAEEREAAAELQKALLVAKQLPSGVAIARGRLHDVQKWLEEQARREALLEEGGMSALTVAAEDAAHAAERARTILAGATPEVLTAIALAALMPLIILVLTVLAKFTPLSTAIAAVMATAAVTSIFATPTVSLDPPDGSVPVGSTADDGAGSKQESKSTPTRSSKAGKELAAQAAYQPLVDEASEAEEPPLTPFKRWLARGIQISMGFTGTCCHLILHSRAHAISLSLSPERPFLCASAAVFSLVALFIDSPATATAMVIAIMSLAVQLQDAIGWFFRRGPCASRLEGTVASQLIESAATKLNDLRAHAAEEASNVTSQVTELLAATREPVGRLRTADPDAEHDVAKNSLPSGAMRLLSAYDDLGYRMRHSAFKCLAAILTGILAFDSALKWLLAMFGHVRSIVVTGFGRTAKGPSPAQTFWAASAVVASGGLLSPARCTLVDSVAESRQGVGILRSSSEDFSASTCKALGQPARTCDMASSVWIPPVSAGREGTGLYQPGTWERERVHEGVTALNYAPAPTPTTRLRLHYRAPHPSNGGAMPILVLRLQPSPASPDQSTPTILLRLPDWNPIGPLILRPLVDPTIPQPAFVNIPARRPGWRAVSDSLMLLADRLANRIGRCERVASVKMPRTHRSMHVGSVAVLMLRSVAAEGDDERSGQTDAARALGIDALAIETVRNESRAATSAWTLPDADQIVQMQQEAGTAALQGLAASQFPEDIGARILMDEEGLEWGEGESEDAEGGEGGDGSFGSGGGGASFMPPLGMVAALASSVATAAATEDFVRREIRPVERDQAAAAERKKRERRARKREAEARLRVAVAPKPLEVDVDELERAIQSATSVEVARALVEDAAEYLEMAKQAGRGGTEACRGRQGVGRRPLAGASAPRHGPVGFGHPRGGGGRGAFDRLRCCGQGLA